MNDFMQVRLYWKMLGKRSDSVNINKKMALGITRDLSSKLLTYHLSLVGCTNKKEEYTELLFW